MNLNAEIAALMDERFGHDALIALATLDGSSPAVRTVNAYYEDGSFYVVTHARSGKMQQIAQHQQVALCGEWFTAHGVGKNMGAFLKEENRVLADRLRCAFSSWFSNGHVNEADPDTIILQLQLTDGILFHHGVRYDISFTR